MIPPTQTHRDKREIHTPQCQNATYQICFVTSFAIRMFSHSTLSGMRRPEAAALGLLEYYGGDEGCSPEPFLPHRHTLRNDSAHRQRKHRRPRAKIVYDVQNCVSCKHSTSTLWQHSHTSLFPSLGADYTWVTLPRGIKGDCLITETDAYDFLCKCSRPSEV